MKHEKRGDAEISAKQFPALRAFMRGYLHQDFGEEYGSVEGAVRAFCEDASAGERKSVTGEWDLFLKAVRGKSVDEVNALLGGVLGSRWNAESLDDLQLVTRVLASGRGA
jgi:hypothetical protein